MRVRACERSETKFFTPHRTKTNCDWSSNGHLFRARQNVARRVASESAAIFLLGRTDFGGFEEEFEQRRRAVWLGCKCHLYRRESAVQSIRAENERTSLPDTRVNTRVDD